MTLTDSARAMANEHAIETGSETAHSQVDAHLGMRAEDAHDDLLDR
jgi:hypothetical protein